MVLKEKITDIFDMFCIARNLGVKSGNRRKSYLHLNLSPWIWIITSFPRSVYIVIVLTISS